MVSERAPRPSSQQRRRFPMINSPQPFGEGSLSGRLVAVVVSMLMLAMAGILADTVRGLGDQESGAVVNLISTPVATEL
jgi:hypothetical protein